jgi:hypothetical protein
MVAIGNKKDDISVLLYNSLYNVVAIRKKRIKVNVRR